MGQGPGGREDGVRCNHVPPGYVLQIRRSDKTNHIRMDENNNKVMDSARTLYAYLKEHCVGKQTSTWDLARKASLSLEDDDLWAIHDALRDIVEEEGEYEMYLGSYANEIVGLLYNIPFKFRPKKKR